MTSKLPLHGANNYQQQPEQIFALHCRVTWRSKTESSSIQPAVGTVPKLTYLGSMISCFAYKCPMDCSFAGASARFELIKRLLHQMYHGGIPSQDPSSGFPWFSASGFPKLKKSKHGKLSYPTGSMYGIYANIGGILMVNVTIYIHT